MKKQTENDVGWKKSHRRGRTLYVSVILVLAALVSVTAATIAWFSIAEQTRVKSMNMEVTTGYSLRIDTQAHATFDEYVKTLGFEAIAQHIQTQQGYDMRNVPLEPVTTSDGVTYTLEDGTAVESDSGMYWEFVLHFMATQDMVVHLTSEDGSSGGDGTLVTSQDAALLSAMRISFSTENQTSVYLPGAGAAGANAGEGEENVYHSVFGLPNSTDMVYNDENALFTLQKNIDRPVTVRIWLEGTDPSCTDERKGADFGIRFRFEGTDQENQRLTER